MVGRIIDGKQLKLLREEAGLHRRQLAELIHCSPGHLKNIEVGGAPERHQPSAVLVYRILRVLSEHLGRRVDPSEFSSSRLSEACVA